MKLTQKKFTSRILGCLLILALVIVMIPAMPGEAASRKTKAIAAYRKMLSGSTVTVVPKTVRSRRRIRTYSPAKASNVRFFIAYIDSDSVPELILNDTATDYYGIWTYRNGKVVNLDFILNYKEPGYHNKAVGYYRKKGIIKSLSAFPGGYTGDYCRISNGTAKEVLFTDKDQGDTSASYYYITGSGCSKKVSKGIFGKKLKSYIGSTKMTAFVMRRNTASNRKNYLK